MKYGYITQEIPIDPGEGWEIVPYHPETVIQDDWEVFGRLSNAWHLTVNSSLKMGNVDFTNNICAYRRRIPKPFLDVEALVKKYEQGDIRISIGERTIRILVKAINEAMAERDKKQ